MLTTCKTHRKFFVFFFLLMWIIPSISFADFNTFDVNNLSSWETAISSPDLNAGDIIYINGKIPLDGEFDCKGATIQRYPSGGYYNGTLFIVDGGKSATLKNVTIDSGNNWTYQEDLVAQYKQNPTLLAIETQKPENYSDQVTRDTQGPILYPTASETGKPSSVSTLITIDNGTLTLDKVTIQNFYSVSYDTRSSGTTQYLGTSGSSLIKITGQSTLNLKDSTLQHNATGGSGAVAYMSGTSTINIDNTVITNNYCGVNGGLFEMNGSSTITLDKGTSISNTFSTNSNGHIAIIKDSSNFIIQGGSSVTDNYAIPGVSNGRCGAFYVYHANSRLTVIDGTISNNTGYNYGGVDCRSGALIMTGGSITDNISQRGYPDYDIHFNSAPHNITGGNFSQNITPYIASGHVLRINDDGTFTCLKPDPYLYEGTYTTDVSQYRDPNADYIVIHHKNGTWTILPKPTNLPLTGDSSMLMLHILLLGAGLSALLMRSKRLNCR